MSSGRRRIVSGLVVASFLLVAPAHAKESTDIQNQLNSAESALQSASYCVDSQSRSASEFDGYIASTQKSLEENPGNASLTAQLQSQTESRQTIARMLSECIGLVSARGSEVATLRARLAAALAAETAQAAAEAKSKVLSEEEAKAAVTNAATESEATKQRIQTDAFTINDTSNKIEALNNSLQNVDKNSTTYAQVQASIAALENLKQSSEARLQKNIELQSAQKSLLEELNALQTNAVRVNAAAAAELLSSSKEAKENLDQQSDTLSKEVGGLEDQVKKLNELLGRISKDSPDYAKLLATRDSLTTSITQVKADQAAIAEAVKKNEELEEQARKETLSSRLETSIFGKLLDDEDVPEAVLFKAKKVNSKFSEIRTKLIDSESDAVENLALESEDLEGLKVTLKAGKKSIKVNKVELNDDGTLSFRIPRATKSGNYSMTVDIPDSDEDISLKVKIKN
jgi:DNA repair exonuclease SbcCD ATPase subunit